MVYGKTILSCFKNIDSIVKQIENLIVKKAKASFYGQNSALSVCEELIALSEVRLDLLELKDLTETAISKLKTDDANLIKFKYFNILPNIDNFDHTSRNYFRKQVRAIEKFHKILESLGLTEQAFFDKYLKIAFIKGAYQKTLKEEGKKHER